MRIQQLEHRVRRYFQSNPHEWGLVSDEIGANYILNIGGFTKQSFLVRDRKTRLHVKLAPTSESTELKRWHRVAGHLSRHYHAPVVRGWVEIPEAGLSGLVFDFIDGKMPENWCQAPQRELVAAVSALHRDGSLLEQLETDRRRSCAEVYDDTYGDRFREDFKTVAAERPPFVEPATVSWMQEELLTLSAWTRAAEAFAMPADCPIHSDLWLNNLLLTETGWFLLDWDDLQIGDPALDLAMLGGPAADALARRGLLAGLDDRPGPLRERISFYQRAALFDWTLDVLADWCECSQWLADPTEFRRQKQAVHERALTLYRELYAA